MSHLFWLRDAQWALIEPHVPKNQPGARRVDDRRVISGIIHVLRTGCRWVDCPPEYGPSTTIYNRFNRWSHRHTGDVQRLQVRVDARLGLHIKLAGPRIHAQAAGKAPVPASHAAPARPTASCP